MLDQFEWTKISDTPFTLESVSLLNSNLVFRIVGSDNGSNPATYEVTATRTGDDEDDGNVTRERKFGLPTTLAGTVPVNEALTADMFRRIEHWCREQQEAFLAPRPPVTATKSPYDPRFGK